jgi:hypothetical protein
VVSPMQASTARWAQLLAGTFLVATVVTLLVSLHITTPAPSFAADATLPDNIFASFAAARAAWPQEAAAGVLYALGFLAIAVLGVNLRAILSRSDPAATRIAVVFLVAGIIGIVSQVTYLGVKEVATVPYYCDCDFMAPQLISRGTVLDAVVGMQGWLVDTFSLLFAVGLLAAGTLAAGAAWPAAFVNVSRAFAVLALASVLWDRVAVTLLVNAQVDLDYQTIGLAILGVLAGIAVPVWAWMLSRNVTLGASPAAPEAPA